MMEIRTRLDELIELYGTSDVRALLARKMPESKDEFISQLYQDLKTAIDGLERSAHLLQGESENGLRTRLLRELRCFGYDARPEADERGHSDLLVEGHHLGVVWIGEAKKHGEYAWLSKGMKQLHTRYTTGRHADMALLVFVFGSDASGVMQEWRRRLVDTRVCGLVDGSCTSDLDDELRFDSTHIHVGSGLQVVTRHFFAALYYRPEDAT